LEKPILAALLSVKSDKLSDAEKKLFEKFNPLGVVLLKRNIISAEQTKNLICSIKETIGRDDVIIALDEEGGRLTHLFYENNSLASQNILGQVNDVEITQIHAKLVARQMQKIGANMVLAPVLDIDYPQTTIALKNRCFGNDKEKVLVHGKTMCETYINSGICPCIKHIPGHGIAVNDPHAKLPKICSDMKDLEADFYPFKHLNHMPSAMTAHILLTKIDNKKPISISKIGIQEIIRKNIGFNGMLFSDAIDMHALKGDVIKKAQNVWQSGCDVVTYCLADEQEMINLCNNGIYLQDKALERFEKIKNIICSKKETIILDNQIKKYYSGLSSFTENNIKYDAMEVLHQKQKGEK